mmetsp:Transcript_18318/g.43821  ORF Transcript_18318/g.43821 Transcript_18318/m.43821 type:complete len:208 (+) Transcript_18318:670-1293(+)
MPRSGAVTSMNEVLATAPARLNAIHCSCACRTTVIGHALRRWLRTVIRFECAGDMIPRFRSSWACRRPALVHCWTWRRSRRRTRRSPMLRKYAPRLSLLTNAMKTLIPGETGRLGRMNTAVLNTHAAEIAADTTPHASIPYLPRVRMVHTSSGSSPAGKTLWSRWSSFSSSKTCLFKEAARLRKVTALRPSFVSCSISLHSALICMA